MANQGWVWLAGVVCVTGGCSGQVLNDRAGVAGGAGRAFSAQSDDDGPTAAVGGRAGASSAGRAGATVAPAHAGDAGNDPHGDSCKTSLAEAAAAFGFSCPKEFCAAKLLASDCGALPGGISKTRGKSCLSSLESWSVSFEISPTRRKVCYYSADYNADGIPLLVGATAWDDQDGFCAGSATQISGGSQLTSCSEPDESTLCDLAHPGQGPASDAAPPACFNSFGHSCEPCCPATEPDCSDKPDGYPGYECTSNATEESSYWSCSCNGGAWMCAG